MKKIIAVFFLLICGLVVLLATVDLEPYLAPEQTFTQPEDAKLGDLFQNVNHAETVDEITTGQEHTATPPGAIVDKVAEGVELGQTSSSLIEMEITVLPVGEYPFSILLETFLKQETAQQAILTYQKRGISAYWVKVNLGNEVIRYRLFTGVFSTASEAQLYLEQHQLAGKLIKPTYYSARVGVYQNKLQLINDFIKTRDAGVIPYILSTKKGDYYLYVGAFYTFIGATSQCRYLTEAGLRCEPVKRSTIPPQ
jgi:hypothetical protein